MDLWSNWKRMRIKPVRFRTKSRQYSIWYAFRKNRSQGIRDIAIVTLCGINRMNNQKLTNQSFVFILFLFFVIKIWQTIIISTHLRMISKTEYRKLKPIIFDTQTLQITFKMRGFPLIRYFSSFQSTSNWSASFDASFSFKFRYMSRAFNGLFKPRPNKSFSHL